MKKLTQLLLLTALSLLVVSCQKDPDFDDLSTEFVTYTNYDKNADFASYETFYISDTIKIYSSKVKKWYDENARKIIGTFAQNMKDRGYVQLDKDNKANADLGIQLSYIESTYYFTDYYPYSYWYDYWWGNTYWPWVPVYPAYSITYSYDVGSMLGEIIAIDRESEKLTQIWSMCIGGTMSGSTRYDIERVIKGVNQAFKQSPYIKR